MRKRRVWRYYCDFCKRARCQQTAIVEHEKHCTMNPNRICGMCKLAEVRQVPTSELLKLIEGISFTNSEEKITQLEKGSHKCPACILAILRQGNALGLTSWLYSEANDQWWKDLADKRERQSREEAYAEVYAL